MFAAPQDNKIAHFLTERSARKLSNLKRSLNRNYDWVLITQLRSLEKIIIKMRLLFHYRNKAYSYLVVFPILGNCHVFLLYSFSSSVINNELEQHTVNTCPAFWLSNHKHRAIKCNLLNRNVRASGNKVMVDD